MSYAGIFRSGAAIAALLLAVCLLPAPSPANSNELLIDDFNDGDLVSPVGWIWESFAKNEPEPAPSIKSQVVKDADGNGYLKVNGNLPDDGTGISWGGFVSRFPAERTRPVNLKGFYAIAFRVASDTPGYYKVRLEQAGTGYNSTNVTFPVDDQWQDLTIPLSQFQTGSGGTTGMAFTRFVDTAGAPFQLMIDDVRLLRQAPEGMGSFATQKVLKWAQGLSIGWQEAQLQKKPMLLYFRSDFAHPCQRLETDLIADSEFLKSAGKVVLASVNINENVSLARRYRILRVPSFMVFDPVSLDTRVLYQGENSGELAKAVNDYLDTKPEPPEFAQASLPRQQYKTVMIADFTDASTLNLVDGLIDTFSVDPASFVLRWTEIAKGNLAFEALGRFAGTNGATYGGVYCDITPDRSFPRNLSGYNWLSFIARSDIPGEYQVHLESGPEQQSQTMQINLTREANRFSIPIRDFGPVAGSVTTIVWSRPNPRPGMEFHIVLDDIMVIQ